MGGGFQSGTESKQSSRDNQTGSRNSSASSSPPKGEGCELTHSPISPGDKVPDQATPK